MGPEHYAALAPYHLPGFAAVRLNFPGISLRGLVSAVFAVHPDFSPRFFGEGAMLQDVQRTEILMSAYRARSAVFCRVLPAPLRSAHM